MEERELLVVKYGSSSVVAGERSIEQNLQTNTAWFTHELAKLHKNYDVIVVTSGAVAVGRALWPDITDESDEQTAQFLAMSGNPFVMGAWIAGFRARGIKSGELLLTDNDIADNRTLNSPGAEMRRAVAQTRRLGGIAVVNENDATSQKELALERFGGENDGLSGYIAEAFSASALFLMTDTNGVMNTKGRIRQVKASQVSWDSVREHAKESSGKGRGGMTRKVDVAIEGAQQGRDTYIAHAHKSSFASIRSGRFGTHFLPVPAKS